MLYKLTDDNSLEKLPFYDYSDLSGKEKDLENLLAQNLSNIYIEAVSLMPIFQERQWQPEPDLCALDKDGFLVIFELKRGTVYDNTTLQIMRYAQDYSRKQYAQLNQMYQAYTHEDKDLRKAHQEAFQLSEPLPEEQFNQNQKLVIVGSSSDTDLMQAVDYWKAKGLDIDFLPYRFYKINDETYFEFFAKPYDYHINPRDRKGIIFDTNKSYDENAIWDMFENSKISAYGGAAKNVYRFQNGDYVLYYHPGWGVVGGGIIKDEQIYENPENDELYRRVELLTPKVEKESDLRYISPSELTGLLGKHFRYNVTAKRPYLTTEESRFLINKLNEKYNSK